MASMRKKSGHFYARFYDRHRQPKRKEVALNTTRKDVARRRLTEWERLYAEGAFDPWAPHPFGAVEHLSIAEAKERFLAARSHLRPRSLGTYRGIIERWAKALPATLGLRDVRADHLAPFVHAPEVSNATHCKRYGHLRAFFRWCVEEGLIPASPLSDVRQPKKQKKAAAFLSTGDLERLLRAMDAHAEVTEDATGRTPDVGWLADMVRVAVCTGLRRGELARLRWQDVDLEEGRLTVRSRDGEATKSGNERMLPLAPDALAVLLRRHVEREEDFASAPVFTDRRGLPIKLNRISHRFKDMVRVAKLDDRLHFHSLRHTCGSWLAMKGVPMRVIQAILGHSSIAVTERYSHLQPEVMDRAITETFGA